MKMNISLRESHRVGKIKRLFHAEILMKKRLISVEHDTDDFPDYLLKMIDLGVSNSIDAC